MFFGDKFTKGLNATEVIYYNLNISTTLKKYIIYSENDHDTGVIQENNGYTNLRKDKNTASEVIPTNKIR